MLPYRTSYIIYLFLSLIWVKNVRELVEGGAWELFVDIVLVFVNMTTRWVWHSAWCRAVGLSQRLYVCLCVCVVELLNAMRLHRLMWYHTSHTHSLTLTQYTRHFSVQISSLSPSTISPYVTLRHVILALLLSRYSLNQPGTPEEWQYSYTLESDFPG